MDYHITEFIETDTIKIGMTLDEIKRLLINEEYSILKEDNPLSPNTVYCKDFKPIEYLQ